MLAYLARDSLQSESTIYNIGRLKEFEPIKEIILSDNNNTFRNNTFRYTNTLSLLISSEKISEPASEVKGVSSPSAFAIPIASAVLPWKFFVIDKRE
jgi:hypothetical protein